MKPAPFEFIFAHNLSEAATALRESDGDGKVISGGQSLMPVLAMRLSRPELLIDLNRIPGMDYIDRDGDELQIGALARHCMLQEQDDIPLLAEAARWIGHPAIRSRGTIGGSLAHADPAAELPVVATALDGTLQLASSSGTRSEQASAFFVGTMETTLKDDEIVTGINLRIPDRWGFSELSRRHGDFGMVTAAVAEVQGSWRVVIGGISSVAYRSAEAEDILNGEGLAPDALRRAARAATEGIEFPDDIHAPAAYRKAMTEEYTWRALSQAADRTLIGA